MAVLLRRVTEFGICGGEGWTIMSKWLKLDRTVCDRNVAQRLYTVSQKRAIRLRFDEIIVTVVWRRVF